MRWIDILGMCRPSASFRTDEWRFSSITTYLISADSAIHKCSMPSANDRIKQSAILESLFQQSDHFHFQYFLSRAKFYRVTLFGRNIHFLVYVATHCLKTHIISVRSLAVYFFFIVNEAGNTLEHAAHWGMPRKAVSASARYCTWHTASWQTGLACLSDGK